MARPALYSDEELLEVARQTFLELGPKVSTTVIAERAGVSQATLFKRFGSKDELLVRALMPPERPPFLDLIEGGPDERPFAAQLRELLLEMDRFFAGMIPAMMMLRSLGRDHFADLARYEVSPPVRCHGALTAWVERCAQRGLVGDIDPAVLACSLMGTLQTRRFLRAIGGEAGHPEFEPFVDALIRNLELGFAPEEPA